jgi:hypothetical protein
MERMDIPPFSSAQALVGRPGAADIMLAPQPLTTPEFAFNARGLGQ